MQGISRQRLYQQVVADSLVVKNFGRIIGSHYPTNIAKLLIF
jgi:hypothetical protein